MRKRTTRIICVVIAALFLLTIIIAPIYSLVFSR